MSTITDTTAALKVGQLRAWAPLPANLAASHRWHHQVCDGQGRLLVVLLGPGQGSDSRMFRTLLDALSDTTYSSRAHRALLCRRDITAVIGEPDYEKVNRNRVVPRAAGPPEPDPPTRRPHLARRVGRRALGDKDRLRASGGHGIECVGRSCSLSRDPERHQGEDERSEGNESQGDPNTEGLEAECESRRR